MRRFLGFVLLNCLLLSQAHAEGTTVIAAFGDSLFSGYRVVPARAFPVQLEQKLQKDGYNVKVLNDGVAGDTSFDGVSRMDFVLKQKPDMVVIEFGANDLLRGLPPKLTQQNLITLMEAFRDADIRMVLVGQKAPFNYGRKFAQDYNAMYSQLAKTYDVPLYPFFLEGVFNNPDLMVNDHLHPNGKGVAVVVDKIAPVIESLLKK